MTSNWQLIDNGLAMDLHSSGFDLSMDWNWIGSIGLVTNWHWIGNRQTEGLSLSHCSEWMCSLQCNAMHCTVVASIFLDLLNIANPKLNLD